MDYESPPGDQQQYEAGNPEADNARTDEQAIAEETAAGEAATEAATATRESGDKGEGIDYSPDNIRTVAFIYADHISLVRRTIRAVDSAIKAAEASPSVLFNFNDDPLRSVMVDPFIIDLHVRVVDLILLAGLGVRINVREFQDYARYIVGFYDEMDFLGKAKNSQIKNQDVLDVEKEWARASNFIHVQEYFRGAVVAVNRAAIDCDVTLSDLPEF